MIDDLEPIRARFEAMLPDNDEEQTLETLALDLWEVCDQLDADGHHEAAQELRDQCEAVVRDMLQEIVK